MPGEMTVLPNDLLALGQTVYGVGQRVVGAGTPLTDGWAPPEGMDCRSVLITCQGAWNGTFHEMSSTFTSIGDKLNATVGTVASADDDSADQFDATRSGTDGDAGKYERYR